MHRVLQGARDLVVEERQQLVAAVDDPDLGPQRGEGAGVLAADDPRADDGQRPRQPLELEDRVGVEHPGVVEAELGGTDGRRPGGDQDRLAPQVDLVVAGGLVVVVVVAGAVRVPVPAVAGWASVTTRMVWGSRNEAVPWYRTTPCRDSPRSIRLRSLAVTRRSWNMNSATVASRRSERSTP